MSRGVQIALALLAVFAITLVLITPDPTDDVPGILNSTHLCKGQRLTLFSISPPAQQYFINRLPARANSHQRLSTLELFDLDCVYRC